MNPNSISHRLFVAALTAAVPVPPKRAARATAKSPGKTSAPKIAPAINAAAKKIGEWSWSGWQHPTI